MVKEFVLSELNNNKKIFENLLTGLSDEITKWRPEEGKWNLLEIVCHLYDEEREDFRQRVEFVLYTPEKELPPIDPIGWVSSREYSSKNYEEILKSFLQERDKSVNLIKSFENPNWSNKIYHKVLGEVNAEYFYNCWLAHDYHHIRQIVLLKLNYLRYKTDNPLTYAG
ncbi:MAG TPA: DinB family protein [Ignavibacteria bacterium]|nr:DinB family protein [Ignavibacteria bacterium]